VIIDLKKKKRRKAPDYKRVEC